MKKLCILFLALALALSLAACGGSGPSVPGGNSSTSVQEPAPGDASPDSAPEGHWTLTETEDPDFLPRYTSLALDRDGSGYLSTVRSKGEDLVYVEYKDLRWSDGSIVIDGAGGVFQVQGLVMTVTREGKVSTFQKDSDVMGPVYLPPAGSYTSYMVFECGEEYPDDSFSITFNDDGTGSYTGHGETFPMTWNSYFITVDGSQSFYYIWYDGELSVFDGEYEIVLQPAQN
ncbi:MAG: hypothetical protein IK095_08985 [Oscillospiraceae bacterium]|nr:hypothetical protein [Oscillospiraceae bacterium]